MMKWWIKMGYPAQDVLDGKVSRVEGTQMLTDNLKGQYDAVWFKGKGIHRLLDGDQICVFDPQNIYMIDASKYNDFDIGSKVKRKSDGMIGTIVGKHAFEGRFLDMRREWIQKYQEMIDIIESGDDTPIKEWAKYSHGEITPEVRNDAVSELKYYIDGYEGMFQEDDPNQYTVKWNKGGTDGNVYRGNIDPYHGRTKS
jgi:hypothetical protein